MYLSENRSNASFRIEILKESLIPETRNKVSDADLILVFSELPESVNLQKSAHYSDESIPGRSEPWKVYSSSGSTMIDFTARFVATGNEKSSGIVKRAFAAAAQVGGSVAGQIANKSGLGGEFAMFNTWAPRAYRGILDLTTDKRGDDITAATFEEVTKKTAILESLVYTQYNDDGLAFPPPLVNLRYGGNFLRRGIIKDVRLRYMGPWDIETCLCMVVEASVTMEEVNTVPRSHFQVRNFNGKGGDGTAGQPPKTTPFKSRVIDRARSVFGL